MKPDNNQPAARYGTDKPMSLKIERLTLGSDTIFDS